MWLDAMILAFCMLSFKPALSLSSFTLIKRLYCFSLSALREWEPVQSISIVAMFYWRQKKGWQRMKWLDSIRHSTGIHLRKLREIMKDRGAWCAAVHRVTKHLTWLATEHHKPSFKYIRGRRWCHWLLKPLLPGMSPARSSHLKLHISITWEHFAIRYRCPGASLVAHLAKTLPAMWDLGSIPG